MKKFLFVASLFLVCNAFADLPKPWIDFENDSNASGYGDVLQAKFVICNYGNGTPICDSQIYETPKIPTNVNMYDDFISKKLKEGEFIHIIEIDAYTAEGQFIFADTNPTMGYPGRCNAGWQNGSSYLAANNNAKIAYCER